MFLPVFLVSTTLLLTGGVVASSIECTTVSSGYLSSDQTTFSDVFQLYKSNGTLAFDNVDHGFETFPAEFQACTPNYLGYANDGTGLDDTYSGHIFVPSSGLCLSVQDPFSGPPYEVTTAACDSADDEGQILLNWVMVNQKIYYGGETTSDGSTIQGGDACLGSGLYGYQGDDQAIPTAIGYPTPLVCATGEDVHGFILIQ